jgi:hypothetical protein
MPPPTRARPGAGDSSREWRAVTRAPSLRVEGANRDEFSMDPDEAPSLRGLSWRLAKRVVDDSEEPNQGYTTAGAVP